MKNNGIINQNSINNDNNLNTNQRTAQNSSSNKNHKSNKRTESLKIIHWNANSINNKIQEFRHSIIEAQKPDIIALNETKLSTFRANHILCFDEYNVINKSRHENKNGAGGVALLIKKNLKFIQIEVNTIDNEEIIGINLFIDQVTITLFSYYNPPHCNLNINFLTEASKKYQNLLVIGDLNAKSTSLNCKSTNSNGILLEELIINSNLINANNKDPTYHRIQDNSSDILDWCLISNSLYQKLTSFEVQDNNIVDSDHFPVLIILDLKTDSAQRQNVTNNLSPTLNYNKADWNNFASDLSGQYQTENHNIDELNQLIVDEINKACSNNIPQYNQKSKNKPLPEYILDLMKKRKNLKSCIRKCKRAIGQNCENVKKEYNLVSKVLRKELIAIENSKWNRFIDKLGKNPLSSSPFWKKISFHKPRKSSIQTLSYDNKLYHSDMEKAQLFAKILASTFSEDNNGSSYRYKYGTSTSPFP